MRLASFVFSACVSLSTAGCDGGKDWSSALTFTHPADQRQFTDAMSAAGISHSVEVREGKNWVVWAQRDRERAKRIHESLIVPPIHNLSLHSPEAQAQFKAWLRENGIPFRTLVSLGQEYVVWAEKDFERVKRWPKWIEPPATKP